MNIQPHHALTARRHTRSTPGVTVALVLALALGVGARAAVARTVQPTPRALLSTAGHQQALCRVSLPLSVSAAGHAHRTARMLSSSPGTGSCTGTLGPWLMGGQQGWSTATGALNLISGPAKRLEPTSGNGQLLASVPRYAWFHPSMVTFTSTFQLRREGDVLVMTGSCRLTPTAKSPVPARLKLAGTATVRLAHRRSRTSGQLTLQFTVVTTSEG